MRKTAILIWVSLGLAASTAPGWAGLRMLPSWPKLAKQAELIVVGHVAAGDDFVYVSRDYTMPDMKVSAWEFHGYLTVDEVIQGQAPDKRIPILLHLGLTPSRYLKDGKQVDVGRARGNAALSLWDTGSSSMGGPPVLEDLRQPAIWLLSHHMDNIALQPQKSALLGVMDLGEVLPMSMLPFVRTLLLPDPGPGMIDLLGDKEVRVRREAIRYLWTAKDQRAVPSALTLMKDPDWLTADTAKRICEALAGKDAIPGLRAQLADETQPGFANAVAVLAALHDTGSTARFVELAKSSPNSRTRALMISNLGTLGDPAAIPVLIDALKDGNTHGSDDELWQGAQAALLKLTGCRLSPNDDKARRWWQAAKDRPPEAWRHFGIAQRVRSFLSLGPYQQENANEELLKLTGVPRPPNSRFSWVIPAEYQPQERQRFWQNWLAGQNWTDYQGLPWQDDTELTARAEPAAPAVLGKPLHLRWTVRNVGPREVWVCRNPVEMAVIRYVNGNGGGDLGSPVRRAPTAGDFVLLAPGESFLFEGAGDVLHSAYPEDRQIPSWVVPGLHFDRKGTSFGHDAWVGEVWAGPFTLSPSEGAAK